MCEYDFGDSWDHLIEVEDELRANAVTKHVPYCIAGERACPPEDCDGPSAYSAFPVAFGNPDNQ